jgi:hypothetical protein
MTRWNYSVIPVALVMLMVGGCTTTSQTSTGRVNNDGLPARDSTVSKAPTTKAVAGTSEATFVTTTTVFSGATTNASAVSVASDASDATNTSEPNVGSASGCAAEEVDNLGQLTWIAGGRVMSLVALPPDPDSVTSTNCLWNLGTTNPSMLRWSPTGDRVLFNPDVISSIDGTSTRTELTSFDNPSWSTPTGKALLTLRTNKLTKHVLETGVKADVSFLDSTIASVYHPAGKHIVSVGTADEGDGKGAILGVWLADNLGKNRKLLVNDLSVAAVSEPQFDGSGNGMLFVAQHAAHSHVHRYNTATSKLETLIDDGRPLSNLVVQQVDDGSVAARVGDCTKGKGTDVVSYSLTGDADQHGTSYLSKSNLVPGNNLSPVGWVGDFLAVLSRENSCEGPGDLWLVLDPGLLQPVDNDPSNQPNVHKIASGVTLAAVRGARGTPRELGEVASLQVET